MTKFYLDGPQRCIKCYQLDSTVEEPNLTCTKCKFGRATSEVSAMETSSDANQSHSEPTGSMWEMIWTFARLAIARY